MTNRVAPDVAWVVDDVTGVVVGQRLADGTVADPGFSAGGGAGIALASAPLSASAVVKGVAGDPGTFISIFCVSVSGGKVTVRNGGTIAGALVSGLGDGGASGLALTAGQHLSLGAAVDMPNGIFLEINGTGTYVVIYQ